MRGVLPGADKVGWHPTEEGGRSLVASRGASDEGDDDDGTVENGESNCRIKETCRFDYHYSSHDHPGPPQYPPACPQLGPNSGE